MKDISTNHIKEFYFAKGEMADLISNKNWEKTPLGAIKDWQKSLYNLLHIILSASFPMFLFWGPDLICFYNDAFRPSLGKDGKHPYILGMRGEEAWAEIWEIIQPLINQVMNGGGGTWHEDQLIPIFRNGKIEDAYWTFSHSPVNDDDGNIGGVLVSCIETTDKIITQLLLQESERKFRSMILQAPVSICILRGTDYIIEMVNSQALKLLARKEVDLLHKPMLQSMPELKSQGIKEMLDGVYNSGKFFSALELPVQIERNGKLENAYFNISYDPLINADGLIDRIIATGFEVTEQVINRKKIEESEKKLNIVLAASELGTFDLDLIEDVVDCSTRMNEIFGIPSSKKKNNSEFLNTLFSNDIDVRNKELNQAFSTGNISYQSRILLAKQTFKWVEIKGKVFYDDNKIPVKIVGTCADITKEKVHQEELEEREQKFQLVAENMLNLVWMANADGWIYWYNKRWYDYTGKTAAEMEGWGWQSVHDVNELPKVMAKWRDALAKGEIFEMVFPLKGADGEFKHFLTRVLPIKNTKGEIYQWVGTNTDISEQKNFAEKLENEILQRTKELADKNQDLQKMNKELQSFAYISSHDLQEPLRKIQIFVSRIIEKEKDNLSDAGIELFKRMQHAAHRMQSLINDLLSYSRSQTAEHNFEKTDLNIVIASVIDDLKEEIELKQAVIEIQKTCVVPMIPFQFGQLFYNLISNSLKFAKPDISLRLTINCECLIGDKFITQKFNKNSNYYHIAVKDNGIGFEPLYNEKIFELFQKLHSKDEFNGTGIGLAIVKKIVENHKGIIKADGQLGIGTTFNIYLPIEEK